MILADTTYAGQLNVSDWFTRMVLSLVATGIAPGSFYQLDADGNRQRAHFDGLPVEFVAEAIATLGAQVVDGFQTYHVMNPHDDGIGFDEYVDWLIEAGYPIQRIGDFGEWLQRFETGLRALPDRQRQHSVLEVLLLRPFQDLQPAEPMPRVLRADRPIPCRGARRENRPRQRHPARLGADHHQIRHRPATARGLERFHSCGSAVGQTCQLGASSSRREPGQRSSRPHRRHPGRVKRGQAAASPRRWRTSSRRPV